MSDVIPDTPAKIGGAFTKKLGPLPGWAWLLIAVGGAYAVYYYRTRNTAPATTDAVTDSAAPAALPTDSGAVLPTGGGVTAPASATNAEWARNTVNSLIAAGQSPTDANNAIAAYLNGAQLTAVQQAIVNIAITLYGAPPEGIIPIIPPTPVVTPPKVVPPSKVGTAVPAKAHTYTVQKGDSLSSIAQRFYGNAGLWTKIYNDAWNHSIIKNPNLIYAGQVLDIPA